MRNKGMLWAGIASIVFVALLTFLLKITVSEFFLGALFPGEIASILITGGHGGTNVEECVGTVVSIIVNALVYFAVFELLILVRRRMWKGQAGGPGLTDHK